MVEQGREIAKRTVLERNEKVPHLVMKHRPQQQVLDPGHPLVCRRITPDRMKEPGDRSDDRKIQHTTQVG